MHLCECVLPSSPVTSLWSAGLLFISSPLPSGRAQPACNYWLHLRGIPTGTDTWRGTTTTILSTFPRPQQLHLENCCCVWRAASSCHSAASNERIMTLVTQIVSFTENIFSLVEPRLFTSSLCPVRGSAQTQTHGCQRKLSPRCL